MSWIRDRLANRLVRLISGRSSDRISSTDEDESGEEAGALRNGDVVLIGGSDSEDEVDDSDNYSTEEEMVEQPELETEMRTDSSLKHDLMSISGKAGARNVFPKSLIDRETGFRTKPFIGSHLLPRKREQMALIRAKVFCGTYDKTGDMFLSASQDCQIRVYDTSFGNFKLRRTIYAQDVGWSILDTAISPSGQQFLYTSWSPIIRLCNIPGPGSQHEILNLESVNRNIGIFSVRFSPSGLEVIAGASDHCVYVYDLSSRRQVLRIRAQENDVNAVAFADASSNIIVSGGDEGVLKVWDRRQLVDRRPKPVGVFAGHFDGITFIDPREDNRHLISNSKDQTIKLWDMRCFAKRGAIEESKALTLSGHWDYRWAPVPRRVTMNRDRMTGDTSIMTYRGHTVRQTLIRCHFSPSASTGQRYIYTGCASGSVLIYDALTGEIVSQLHSHMQICRDVSWHPYFPELVSSSWDGSIVKWFYADDEILTSQDSKQRRARRPSLGQDASSRHYALRYQVFDDL